MSHRRKLPSPVEISHWLIRQHVSAAEHECVLIDATVGNGQDTRLLAEIAGPAGRVIGFEIQEQGLAMARARLDELEIAETAEVDLLLRGHERLAETLRERKISAIHGAMFNLGYLPRAEKTVITQAETTLSALEQAEEFLAPGGIITLVLYTGHPGGAEEAAAVLEHVQALVPTRFDTAHWHSLGHRDNPPPEVVAILRRA